MLQARDDGNRTPLDFSRFMLNMHLAHACPWCEEASFSQVTGLLEAGELLEDWTERGMTQTKSLCGTEKIFEGQC